MGQSTNAVLAYGWAFDEEWDMYGEEDDDGNTVMDDLEPKLKRLGLTLDQHCSGECPMPALIVTASEVTAYRGSPMEIKSLKVGKRWDAKLKEGLARVKEAFKDAEYPPEFVSTKAAPGWVLYSWWC